MKNLHKLRFSTWAGVIFVIIPVLMLLSGCAGGRRGASVKAVERPAADLARENEALALGVEAYIYGYPLVTMEMTRRVMTNVAAPEGHNAPMGRFANMKTYPDAASRDVPAPNADVLYSTAWLDLSKGPYVLSLPNEKGRYYLMPILTGWTEVISDPGKRTTGTRAQKYAITGPGWTGTLPRGVEEIKSATNMVWIIGRTYCTGTRGDYRAVHAVQDRYGLIPLSSYGKSYTPPSGTVDPTIDMNTPVKDQVNRMDAHTYFSTLATLLKENPPAPEDAYLIARMARIGIVPGMDFDMRRLDPNVARGLARAPRAALERIAAHAKDAGMSVNGWSMITRTGVYGTDYLQRAYVAAVGLGAGRPQDALYPFSQVDADGKAYDGANKYVMHFPKGRTPPVDGFWSLTMYDDRYFFAANQIDRYTLSPRDHLKYNRDGSLDLYIQHESPGKREESNWLPAPSGRFVLMLRAYWPKQELIDGAWKPPAVELAR